jgi:hypothetical protein
MSPKVSVPVLVLATLAAALPAAAIDVPQTRQEFVQAAAGKGATAAETALDQRPSLEKVYAILEERVPACLDVKVERTAYVGYVERSSTDYNPTLTLSGSDRAELTLQVVHHPRPVGATIPANGLYVMAADLRAVEGGTEIVLYRPTLGFKKIVASLKPGAGDPARPNLK